MQLSSAIDELSSFFKTSGFTSSLRTGFRNMGSRTGGMMAGAQLFNNALSGQQNDPMSAVQTGMNAKLQQRMFAGAGQTRSRNALSGKGKVAPMAPMTPPVDIAPVAPIQPMNGSQKTMPFGSSSQRAMKFSSDRLQNLMGL